MSNDTTKAEMRAIVNDAKSARERAAIPPTFGGIMDATSLIERLAVVVDRLVVPHMADGPEVPQAPREDVRPGLRKAVAVLRERLGRLRGCIDEREAIVGCIASLEGAMDRAGKESGEAPNQGGSPASQPVYVALFREGSFWHLGRQESTEAACGMVDGWNEATDAWSRHGNGYDLPRNEARMRECETRAEVEKAMKAWADAVQSDGVAEQKDGPRAPAAQKDHPVMVALQAHLSAAETAPCKGWDVAEIRRCIAIVRKALGDVLPSRLAVHRGLARCPMPLEPWPVRHGPSLLRDPAPDRPPWPGAVVPSGSRGTVRVVTTFAQALRTAREKRGLGRGALASIIGHDPTSIARWEKGGSLPTGTRARRIMDALPELAPFLGTSVLVQSDGAKAPVLAKRAITPRQKSVLEFIERFALEHGYPPGVREIMTAIGIRSTNGAVDHLKALERKGFIRIDAMKARGIVVVQSCIDRQERIRKLREEIAAKQVLLAELEAEEA